MPIFKLKSLLTAVIILCVSPVFAAEAEIGELESASNKIKIAGQLQMLSQRIVKSVCFASLNIPSTQDRFLGSADLAIKEFEDYRRVLRRGDEARRVLPEKSREIVGALGKVDLLWTRFTRTATKVLKKKSVEEKDLVDLARLGNVILDKAQDVADAIETNYAGVAMDASFARAISIAERQTMLSQRAAKEYCLLFQGIKVEQTRQALADTAALFDDSIFALSFGNPEEGIRAPDTIEIEWHNIDILGVWYRMNEVLHSLQAGQSVDDSDHIFVAQLSDLILNQSDIAVSMYHELVDSNVN